MSEEVVAKRYARALFEIAAEKQAFDGFEQDLNLLNESLGKDKETQSFLAHPRISKDAKIAVVKQAFEGKISDDVLSLYLLLLERGREGILTVLVEDFVNMANVARNIVDATVTTAAPMSADEIAKLAEQFGQTIGKTVRMAIAVDASIIGGMIIRIGDRLFDGSVKGKLFRFKQSLVHA